MKILISICLSFLLVFSLKAQDPKNVLIIVADDLGWNDVGFHDSDIKTPTLDQFAKESMELTRFYVSPICSPTRAGLMTGKYPDRYNLRGHVYSPRHKSGVPAEEVFLPELLKEAGYGETAAFGKWHLGHADVTYHPNNRGFDLFYGHYNGAIDYFTRERDGELDWHRNNTPSFEEGYSTDLIGDEVVKFINESKKDEPFFAYVAFNAPHSPMQAKIEDLEEYGYNPDKKNEDYPVGGSRPGERGLDTYGMQGRGNTLRQTFSAMVSSMDESIGKILQALEANNLKENTIVWFLSDNGGVARFGGDNTPLRGGKHTEWEGGVRVVSLIRWPGKTQPNTKSTQLTAYIDIVPTIISGAGSNSDIQFDGVDIMDAIEGRELPDRFLYLGGSGIITQTWKMNEGELFKIEEDPVEQQNIADRYPNVVKLLELRIKEFEKMRPDKEAELQPEGWEPPAHWTMPVSSN